MIVPYFPPWSLRLRERRGVGLKFENIRGLGVRNRGLEKGEKITQREGKNKRADHLFSLQVH